MHKMKCMFCEKEEDSDYVIDMNVSIQVSGFNSEQNFIHEDNHNYLCNDCYSKLHDRIYEIHNKFEQILKDMVKE